MRTPDFRVQMLAKSRPIIEIYDEIGPAWLGMIEEKTIANALKEIGNVPEIEVRFNSLGGDAYDGLAIGNLFKAHPAKFFGRVMGVAASAATLALMGCDTITIPKNALLMIHDPVTFAFGDEEEMRKAMDALSTVKDAGIETYAAKNTKKSKEQIAAMMKEETWMTGEQAVEEGFADQTEAEVALPKVEQKAVARFRKAPSQFASLLAISMQATEVPMAEHAAPVIPTPTLATAITQAQMDAAKVDAAKEARASERQRSADITALCSQAGRPDLVAGFLEGEQTVADVQAHLFKTLCAERKPVDGGGGGAGDPPPADPDAKFKAEYAADRAYFKKSGTSEADYVMSRRISEGLDTLRPNVA